MTIAIEHPFTPVTASDAEPEPSNAGAAGEVSRAVPAIDGQRPLDVAEELRDLQPPAAEPPVTVLPEALESESPTEDPAAAPQPAPVLTAAELCQAVEALLFASQNPLTLGQLRDLTAASAEATSAALASLGERYAEGRSGVVLAEVANGWLFRTGRHQGPFVRALLGIKPQRLTRAALETLALIAYRQPITRPEMEDVRGVDCGAVVKALLERKMVKILGKKEEAGRPLLYGTTREFLQFFNLKSLVGLPTLREFHELSVESRKIVEEVSGEGASPTTAVEGLATLADGALAARLEDTAGEGADALADLEAAMAEAELRAKRMSAQLEPELGEGEGAADPISAKGPRQRAARSAEPAPEERLN